MNFNNNASWLRREVLTRVAKMIVQNRLIDDAERIPYEMIPKESEPLRCCIHHDRAVVHARVIASLGFRLEETEKDEGRPLRDFALEAAERETVTGPFLTMLQTACNSCLKTQFMVTNACQGCIARPCMMNCPKNAIDVHHQRAHINGEKCINCGICLKVCPYTAIVKLPIPCEEACPVDAISKDENGKEKIDFARCIGCGKCISKCPFGAMMERSQMVDVMMNMQKGRKVIAFFAPAIVPQFPNNSPGKLITALRKCGFADAVEVARGADITSEREAHEFTERMKAGETLMTTSCCPAYYEAVQKHIPELKKNVSETQSPMIYTAELLRRQHPDAILVFIGPCLAKRREGIKSDCVDYVLSMEELGAILIAKDIQLAQCDEAAIENPPSASGRGYALSGGVAAAVKERLPSDAVCHAECINGLNKQSMKLLKLYGEGKMKANLLEVMACEGGCIAGPSVIANPQIAAVQLKKMIMAQKEEK